MFGFFSRNISAGERIYLSEKRNIALRKLGKEKMSKAASAGNIQRKENVIGFDHMVKPDNASLTNHFDKTVANDAGVGEGSVRRFRAVERDAPELVPGMRSGEIQVATAYTVSKMEPDQRKEVLSKIESGLPAQEAVRAVRAK